MAPSCSALTFLLLVICALSSLKLQGAAAVSSCLVDGHVFADDEEVPPATPCQAHCRCQSGNVTCTLIQCSPPPSSLLGHHHCLPFYDLHSCCPTYDCGAPGSYSILRNPRIELKHTTRDAGAVLYFYNLDTLSVSGSMDKAVNCTVTGGHIEYDTDGWKPAKSVVLKSSSHMETWLAPKVFGAGDTTTLQTRTTYNVSYDVEGNLTCTDGLGLGLVSNTLLLRRKNAESVIVCLSSDLPLEELRKIPDYYEKYSYSKQKGRMLAVEKDLKLRVSYYSEAVEFDQIKVVADVRELTEYIAKKINFTIKYVRSTRSCLPVNEGGFTWPMTAAGRTVIPENPCLDDNWNPMPRRQCVGSFFDGVYWDVLPPRPHICQDHKDRSTILQNITKSFSRKNFIEVLANEILDGTTLTPVEVYFVAEALRKTSQEIAKPKSKVLSINISTVVSEVNSILHSGMDVIKMADDSYGSSSTILEAIEKLMVASASPMPTPVSMLHFSAFASTAGIGIQGFAYIPNKSPNGVGKMITFDKKNTLQNVLVLRPNVVAYLSNATEDFGITSTLYEDGSLFSAATAPGTKLEGPVFGMKLFQRGMEELEVQKPVIVKVRFLYDEKKPLGLQCVSWEPSREGTWAPSGCVVLISSDKQTFCSCTLLTSLDMFFTVLRDEESMGISKREPRLDLLPLKYNTGALLHVFNANNIKYKGPLEDIIKCTVSWNSSGHEEYVSPRKITEETYGYKQKLIIYRLSYNGDGYVQCKNSSSLISNRSLMLILNTALLRFSVLDFINTESVIHNYVIEHDLDLNFTKLLGQNETGVELFHVSQYTENNHLKFIKELEHVFQDLASEYNFSLIDIKSNRLCLKHEEGGFTWPNTKPGHLATPINPCIDTNGTPVPTRRCFGDYLNGMYWDKVPQRPDPCYEPSKRTKRLQDLSTKTVKKDIFQELLEKIKGGPVISYVELNILTEALKNAADEAQDPNSEAPKPNITTIANMVNTVLEAEMEIKRNENATVSSEGVLDSIDKLLQKSTGGEPTTVQTTHFSAAAANSKSKLRGFVEVVEDSSSQTNLKPVLWNSTVDDVLQQPVSTGAFLLEAPEDVGVTFTTFKNDTLFEGGADEDSRVDTPVVGLKMFGKDGQDLSDESHLIVLVLFSRGKSGTSGRRICHYWDTKEKKWSKEGCTKVPSCNLTDEIPTDMDACMCMHLTHFAMLVSSVEHQEEYILNMLTIVGCSISVVCLFGIFLIAVFSPQWRRGASKKVQLNLSASLAMLMASYLTVALQGECPKSMASCVALGALVHYSVLSAFSWMFVATMLQLLRLTPGVSMDARRLSGTHLTLKASIIGWGVPMIPVGATLGMGTDLYTRRMDAALCYPTGRAFYISVLLPVAFAIALNAIVFAWLMRTLFCNKIEYTRLHHRVKRRQALRRYFSAMFLFCLLGITWITSIFFEVSATSETVSKFLSYAFCATATLQGTSLFIFFVACERRVGNKMFGTLSFLARKTVESRKGYTTKFGSSDSDKTTANVELSRTVNEKSNRYELLAL